MRKSLLIITICSLFFSACHKTDNSNSYTNTVGILDNGMDMKMTSTYPVSNENNVEVTMIKTGSSTALVLSAYNTSSNRQFELHLKAYGSYTGIGTFTQTGNNGDNQFYEYFANGQNYTIDHSDINVDNSNDNYISGTYTLYLINAMGTKTATGYFVANRPTIQ